MKTVYNKIAMMNNHASEVMSEKWIEYADDKPVKIIYKMTKAWP